MKFSLALVATAFGVLSSSPSVAGLVPSNCAEFNDHVYCLQTAPANGWAPGKAAAESSSYTCPDGRSVTGRMATFATQEEAAWALDPAGTFNSLYSGGAWIGGLLQQGAWEWSYSQGTLAATDPDWAPNEPSNYNGEDCLNIINGNSPGWNDGYCGYPNPDYFAEYDCTSLSAGVGGDPHFKTWAGNWYDYHGECDLVLLQSPAFGQGLGLDINIRTTARYEYSYIESAAIKIGDDILEVSSFGQYFLNGVEGADLPVAMSDLYHLSHKEINTKEHSFVIQVGTGEQLVVNTFKDLVAVKVENATFANFADSVGLMGSFGEGKMLSRDGKTGMEEEPNSFGQEWQILATEPKLFQATRAPQHPQLCSLPEPAKASRRLGESIAREAADKACDHLGDGDVKDMCVFDVLATGDLEVAQAAGAF